MCICMHVCACLILYIYTCIYVCICMCLHTYTDIHIHTHMYTHACMSKCACVYVFMYMHLCMCVYVYIYTHYTWILVAANDNCRHLLAVVVALRVASSDMGTDDAMMPSCTGHAASVSSMNVESGIWNSQAQKNTHYTWIHVHMHVCMYVSIYLSLPIYIYILYTCVDGCPTCICGYLYRQRLTT